MLLRPGDRSAGELLRTVRARLYDPVRRSTPGLCGKFPDGAFGAVRSYAGVATTPAAFADVRFYLRNRPALQAVEEFTHPASPPIHQMERR